MLGNVNKYEAAAVRPLAQPKDWKHRKTAKVGTSDTLSSTFEAH